MFKKLLLALVASVTAAGAMAAKSPDDIFLEKIRFIQYHAPQPGDYRNATRQLVQSVDQSNGLLLGALGRAFMRLQDFENANSVLTSAVRISPSNAEAQADLAFVSAVHGPDCAASRAAYTRAIQLDPALADLRHVQQAQALCALR